MYFDLFVSTEARVLLFPGPWNVSGLGLFGPRKFIPIPSSVPIFDVKLEALLAGSTQMCT